MALTLKISSQDFFHFPFNLKLQVVPKRGLVVWAHFKG